MRRPLSPGISSTDAIHGGASRSSSEMDEEDSERQGLPAVRATELRLAALEATEDALVFPSGAAALSTALMSLTRAGDHVVLFRDCHRRTRQFVIAILGRFGVSHTILPHDDIQALAEVVGPRTRAVVVESLAGPFLTCIDLPALVAAARPIGRPRILVDATLATPYNVRPFLLGADLVVHDASVYLTGYHDVAAGVVCGPSSLLGPIRDLRGLLDLHSDPHAVALLDQGLSTLALRMDRQNTSALSLAQSLERHPTIEQVFYPLLPSHPSHSVARKLLHGGGGVVSFVVKGGREAAARVVSRCKLVLPGLASGVETRIEPPALTCYGSLDEEQLTVIGVPPGLVRLSVGLEEPADLLADLLHALGS
ncbi:MAG: PLP-dependent transferase [Myxococcales bacterium]|nr:PLP-dependent transferase [Polyangiaceae bacterium]MDW8248165.1 PLP-dependent transferase [Myxococcales bacterium]